MDLRSGTPPIWTAMVLAAGLGTRMRPLTNGLPKPLIKLADRTLLDHALDRLGEAGIKRAVVNVHYCADAIEAHLRGRKSPQVLISDERGGVLETGGGVKKALPLLGPAPFIVHNADSVWSETRRSNLKMLIKVWRPERMEALLLLAPRDSSMGYEAKGDFHRDHLGRLTRRVLGEEAPFVFAGVSILQPKLFDGIVDNAFSLNVIFDRAFVKNALYGVVLEGTWMHVGTPQALSEAESYLNERRRRSA
jgi:N-acetyl-alpha-D-muramate 1-phosphate uridylyltransferase